MNKIEILAPVGDFACLRAAIQSSADSIYFGVEDLNMRSHATKSSFKISDLEEISSFCKKHGIKAYLTLNTLIYDQDLTKMQKILEAAKNAKIDAIVASDFAVIKHAKKMGLNIHLSTQANVTNIEAIKFFSFFADVIVLARELNLNQIKYICDTIKKENIRGPCGSLIKIEIFTHGALCVAIAGKCYMSLALYNMSANRGKCLQTCRRKFKVIEEETKKELVLDNKYIMSPKDLCTITVLDQIIKSGISILKLEGRGRPPEYVQTVVSCYKEAIKAIDEGSYTKEKIDNWLEKLKTVFNRGFWHGGYYLGNELGKWCGSYGSRATKKKTYVGKATNYFSKIKVAEFQIEASDLKIGNEIIIIGNKTGIVKSQIKNLRIHKEIQSAKKGEIVAFPLNEKIRKNDKLYIIEENI